MWSSLLRLPAAETTIIFLASSDRIMAHTLRICAASAIDEPPNLATLSIVYISPQKLKTNHSAVAAIKPLKPSTRHITCACSTESGVVITGAQPCLRI